MAWLDRLKEGLSSTRKSVLGSLDRLMGNGPDPIVLEDLEGALLGADLGVHTVDRLMERFREEARGMSGGEAQGGDKWIRILKEVIISQLSACQGDSLERLVQQGPKPFVILAVGVNGVGKTTTMAKLAQRFKQQGLSPLLVAGDTFRAAAIEQLEIWGGRIGVEVIRHQHGADPSAVVFDGVAAAKARGVDVLLIDTAGRLHTKTNLMDELRKVRRVLGREIPDAPHEVLLTLDATVGQNALSQAKQFHEAVGVTGIALTKLDGTARGGVVVAIGDELHIPVRLIGVGEGVEDLQDFRAQEFVDALFAQGA